MFFLSFKVRELRPEYEDCFDKFHENDVSYAFAKVYDWTAKNCSISMIMYLQGAREKVYGSVFLN